MIFLYLTKDLGATSAQKGVAFAFQPELERGFMFGFDWHGYPSIMGLSL
jgi:hypothetical protein